MNRPTDTPDWLNRNRFCGLPKGMSIEPRMAAMFSMLMIGRMKRSLPPARNSRMVSGTKMISDTSLVTNIDVKNTPKTRNSDRPTMVCIRRVSWISGRKMFSCLNPSSTVSIIKSVASVRQSMSDHSRTLGGVMNSAMTAAASDTNSMASLLTSPSNPFTAHPPRQLLNYAFSTPLALGYTPSRRNSRV